MAYSGHVRRISESDGMRADDALLCPVCFRMCDGSEDDCDGRLIPPAARRARIEAHRREIRWWEESLEDEPTWRGNGIFRTPPLAYVLWERHKRRVDEAMDAALLRWSLQREHLDPDELPKYDDHLGIVGARDVDETPEPQQPPPEPQDVGCLISAPRPGPHPGVALAVG